MNQFQISGFSSSNQIYCMVNGNEIYQLDYMGNTQLIGKTIATYNELEQTTQEYYNKLVEMGVIVPPKTQEQLMSEMQKSMTDMASIIAGLSNELKELKSRESGQCNCSGDANVPKRESKRGNSKSAGRDQQNAE